VSDHGNNGQSRLPPRVRKPAAPRLLNPPEPDMDALAEVGKAVFDAVVDALPDRLGKALEPHVKGIEAGVSALVGQLVAKELDGRIARLEDAYRHELAETVGQMKALLEQYDARQVEMAQAYAAGQEGVKELLKSLPTPMVYVPPDAIRIDLEQPPAPNVVLREGAVAVTLEQPEPRKTTTTKRIEYGPDGRPSVIRETTGEAAKTTEEQEA
jgi:hypothetical protein